MPASGGSLSDTNVSTNKVVDGQSHYLAYITPDEGKSLKQQGGKETITDSGIPAYPPPGEKGGPGSGSEGRAESRTGGAGEGGTITAPVDVTEQYTSGPIETTETKDSLVTKFKQGLVDNKYVKNVISKMGWVTDNSLMNALGGAIGVIGMLGPEVQSKAITWDLNRKLNKAKYDDKEWYDPEEQDLLEDQIRRAQLSKDDPEHYGQDEYMKDYPGVQPAEDKGGDNLRGLTNIITPYAAHAIGGTTPVTSQAAQWYANLGSGNTNPGAFDLTTQYAKAKAAVSQRLKSTSSVGQIAVADSAFFNFLKDNSLNKGIL